MEKLSPLGEEMVKGLTNFNDTLELIQSHLDMANGHRRNRTLNLSRVMQVVDQVREGSITCTANGGTVGNSYGSRTFTTIVLAARVNGRLRLGIAQSDAMTPSPGRAWKCLQPWGKGNPETVNKKLEIWANLPGIMDLGPV